MNIDTPRRPARFQVLSTKFHIPRTEPETTVIRSGLLKRMADAGNPQLILVRAPAGFGKTTLLAQWIRWAALTGRSAWISLDARDNHPTTFWYYTILALEKIEPEAFTPIRLMIENGSNAGEPDTLIPMINIFETLRTPIYLFFDDFHLIRDNRVLDGVNFLIDHPLSKLKIIMAARASPPLGLSRLRASGRLMEITEPMLAFSKEEIRQFYCGFAIPDITAQTLETLAEKTEGWAAALKLAMLAYQEHGQFDLGHVAGNSGFIGDYLMEEVWQRIPAAIRAALARTSILNRFNSDLITALNPGQTGVLPYISDRRLFLIPLDAEGNWFRFHHLFQEFLQRQLKPSASATALHQIAADWFDAQGLFEEAFDHALAAKNPKSAANILARHTPDLYGQGGDDTLLPYLNRLPAPAVLGHPVLAGYFYAIEVYNGRFEKLEEMAALAGRYPSGPGRTLLTATHTALDAYRDFFVKGDLTSALEKAGRAIQTIPDTHGAFHRMLEFLISLCNRFSGRPEPAGQLTRTPEKDNLFMSGLYIMHQSNLELELGNLKRAGRLVKDEIRRIEESFGTAIPTAYGFLFILQGMVLKEKNRMTDAGRCFAKGMVLVRHTRFVELIIISMGEFALFLGDAGRYDRAHDMVDQAILICAQSDWIRDMLKGYKMQIWLQEGKTDLVADWAGQSDIGTVSGQNFFKTYEFLTLARYWIAAKNFKKALSVLDTIIPEDEGVMRNGRLLPAYLLKAKALFALGSEEKAAVIFARAVELSRNQGYIRCFLAELPGMERLVKRFMDTDGLPQALQKAYQIAMKNRIFPDVKVRIHDMDEQFNAREIEILKFFQQGRSNKETARELSLSVNTIRWYASRIFAKLDVKRRGEAVNRACELKMI